MVAEDTRMLNEHNIYATRATMAARHCKVSSVGGHAVVTIGAPGVGWCVAFESIHWSYDSSQIAGGRLTITDGITTYRIDITAGGHSWLPFSLVKWAENSAVTVTLTSGGAITACLNVMGVRRVSK